MSGKFSFALLSAGVLAFACAPRSHANDPLPGTAVNTHSTRSHNSNAPSLASSLNVAVNDGVNFDFRVTNASDKRIEVNFPSGQTHEIVVLDSLGNEVWRWSKNLMFTASLQNKVMHESDTLSYRGRWDHAAPGRYTLVATLASGNYPLVQRAEFVVR
jgi:hypothetical protein